MILLDLFIWITGAAWAFTTFYVTFWFCRLKYLEQKRREVKE